MRISQIGLTLPKYIANIDSSLGKESACNVGDLVQFQEDLLEKGLATHSSILGLPL